ncbi:IS66 family transposase [Dyadobacter sp. CY261]|uniref:IS66 family transposase n=1 Tax=Dyadobacter sp. CY261 TaxID=2907203 RepID=UPI001F277B3F|nr:IS66 family transposase [Dyadobacter sp. CY261]MCF0075494.1 IS66 family transposase [Dyadobacter sp. CY261]
MVDTDVTHRHKTSQLRFAREHIQIASSTLGGWTKEALMKLEPLYEQLVFDMKSKGYWLVDESPIKVLESDKKGACHQGHCRRAPPWVYHSPLDGVLLFDYQPTRGSAGAKSMLESFKGYPQTGMRFTKSMENGKMLSIWLAAQMRDGTAAADRFERALDNDKTRAQKALSMIQQLYAVERKARQLMPDAAEIKELQLTESLPVINELGKWILEQIKSTLPKKPDRKGDAVQLWSLGRTQWLPL